MAVIYCCPSLGTCTWEGPKTGILEHFQKVHRNILVEDNSFHLDIFNQHQTNFLMHLHGEIYLVQVKVTLEKGQVTLRYGGTHEDASRIRFTLILFLGDHTIKNSNRIVSSNNEGFFEVDVLGLRELVKGSTESITCRIKFDTFIDISENEIPQMQRLNSKSLDHMEMLHIEDPIEVSQIADQESTSEKTSSKLQRSASLQTSSTPKLQRTFSIFGKPPNLRKQQKYDSSLFYLNEFLEDTQDARELLDVIDDRISLLKEYKCTKCDYYITGPIYVCSNNCSLCFGCLGDLDRCPCGAEVSLERNTTLERTRDLTKLPCRFEGCNVTMLGHHLEEHQVQCNHCVYMCPECNQLIGKYVDVEKHFRIAHPSIRRSTSLVNAFPLHSVCLILHPRGVFYCRNQNHGNSVEWSVVHCGHVKIYFECNVLIKSNKVNASKSFNLPKDEAAPNLLKRCVSVTEVKPLKHKNSILEIVVYKPSV